MDSYRYPSRSDRRESPTERRDGQRDRQSGWTEIRDRDKEAHRDRGRDRNRRDHHDDRDRSEREQDRDRDRGRDRDRDRRDHEYRDDRERERDRDRDRSTRQQVNLQVPTGPGNHTSQHADAGLVTSSTTMGARNGTSLCDLPSFSKSCSRTTADKAIPEIFQELCNTVSEIANIKHRKAALAQHAKSREAMYQRTKNKCTEFPSVPELQKQFILKDKQSLDQLDQQLKNAEAEVAALVKHAAQKLMNELRDARGPTHEGLGPIDEKVTRLEARLDEQQKAFEKQQKAFEHQQKTLEELKTLVEQRKAMEEERTTQATNQATLLLKLESQESDIGLLKGQVKELRARSQEKANEPDLPMATREDVETLRARVAIHDAKISELDFENLDTVADIVAEKIPIMERQLQSHETTLEGMGVLPEAYKRQTSFQETLINELADGIDSLRKKMVEVEAKQLAVPPAPDKPDAAGGDAYSRDLDELKRSIQAEFDTKLGIHRHDVDQRCLNMHHFMVGLDNQFSNLTSKSLFERMLAYFAHAYPNNTRLAADLEQVGLQVSRLVAADAERQRNGERGVSQNWMGDAPHPNKRQRMDSINGNQPISNGGP